MHVSDTLAKVQVLVKRDEVRVSDHGYDELAEDDILAMEALTGVANAIVVEDYPDFPKGPSVLVLQRDRAGRSIHVVWGIPKGLEAPAVLVTAYRPNLDRWNADFTKRKMP